MTWNSVFKPFRLAAKFISGYAIAYGLSAVLLAVAFAIFNVVGAHTDNGAIRGITAFLNIGASGVFAALSIPVLAIAFWAWRRSSTVRFVAIGFFSFTLLTLNASSNPAFHFTQTYQGMLLICLGVNLIVLLSSGGHYGPKSWIPLAACWTLIVGGKVIFADYINATLIAHSHNQKVVAQRLIDGTRGADRPLSFKSLTELDQLDVFRSDDDGKMIAGVLFCEDDAGIRLYRNPGYRPAIDSHNGCQPKPIEPGSTVIAQYRTQLEKQLATIPAKLPQPVPAPVPLPAPASIPVQAFPDALRTSTTLASSRPESFEQAGIVPAVYRSETPVSRRERFTHPHRQAPISKPCPNGTDVGVRLTSRLCSNQVTDGDRFQFPLASGLRIDGRIYQRDEHSLRGRYVSVTARGDLDSPPAIHLRLESVVSISPSEEPLAIEANDVVLTGNGRLRGSIGSDSERAFCLAKGEVINFRVCGPTQVARYKDPWDDAGQALP